MLSRCSLMTLGAAGLSLPWLRPSRAATAGEPERRFFFVHCYGGRDTTYVFRPNFGSSTVEMEAEATEAEVPGIRFVDSESRPNVRAFFESWGGQTCIVNGVEVRSVTHERCSRIVMSGSVEGSHDDWGARIAAASTSASRLPHLVFSGRAFTAEHSDLVVRIGTNGQLSDVLSGAALTDASPITPLPSETRAALVDEFVRRRHGAATSPVAVAAARALDDRAALTAISDQLAISDFPTGCQTLADEPTAVWDTFQLGLSRTAMLEYRAWCDTG